MKRKSIIEQVLVGIAGAGLCISLQNTAVAQVINNQGLTINASAQVMAKPIWIRVVMPIKAEAVSAEKAVERLAKHMESVTNELEKLGAKRESIEYAEPTTGLSTTSIVLANMVASGYGAAMNGQGMPQPMPIMVNRAIQQFPQAQQFQPAPALPVAQQRDERFEIPKIHAATAFVAADWDIAGKPTTAIAMLKANLVARIAVSNLDGRLLKQDFTPEQEDDIFEHTKIDVRNPNLNANSQWGNGAPQVISPSASLDQNIKVLYVGIIQDEEKNGALRSAFQTADKLSKQIATASGIKLGKIESITTNVVLGSRSFSPSYANQQAYSVSPFPMITNYVGATYPYSPASTQWEPTLKPNEIRLENLSQSRQTIELSVRYKIE